MSLKPTQFNKQGTEKEQMASYKKKMADIKSRGKPLGGAPPVQIPPLNADPVEGPDGRPLTMEQQAGVLRDPRSPLSPHYNPSLADVDAAVKHEQSELMDPHKLRTARQGETMSKQPGPFGGTLPPEAQQDPNFRPGVGSMYASNQPGLRNSPRAKPGAPQLSQETVEGLEALKRFNEDAQQSQEKQAEDAVKEHIEKDPNDSFIEELGLDTSFIDAIKEERGKLDRQDIREAVEARCKPLSIAQMIEEGELRQFVPIVRGQFEVIFRTVSGEEDLGMKRELYKERNASEIYLFDKLNMMQLAAGIYELNGKPFPDHLNERRRFDQKLFQAKFDQVVTMPLPSLAALSINYSWFDQRARSLFVDLDELKNG